MVLTRRRAEASNNNLNINVEMEIKVIKSARPERVLISGDYEVTHNINEYVCVSN